MSRRGRKPSPLRLVTKTGHRPLPKRATKGPALIKPPDLSPIASELWSRIAGSLAATGILTAAHETSLRILCETYEEYVTARDLYRKAPFWKGSRGQVVRSKHWDVMQASRVALWRSLGDFGLTPAATLQLGMRRTDESADQERPAHWLDQLA